MIQTSSGTLYPAIFAFYKTCEIDPRQQAWVRDIDLRIQIEQYVTASKLLMDQIDRNLLSALQNSSEVMLWGTGQLAMKLLKSTMLKDIKVSACIDKNPLYHGKKLGAIPILGPTDAAALKIPIVIGSVLSGKEIAVDIRKMGMTSPLIFLLDRPEEMGLS